LNIFHEYLIGHSLKLGGTKDQLRWVKGPGTAPYVLEIRFDVYKKNYLNFSYK